MGKIIETIMGDFGQKKKYRETEKRAKALPAEYTQAYNHIKHYLWETAGIYTIEPLISLVELLEEAAANGKHVLDITGPDVAAFADELVRGEKSYREQRRNRLNDSFAKKQKNQ